MHGFEKGAATSMIYQKIPLYPCPSVKSVVKDFLTTDGTEKHGFEKGAAASMIYQKIPLHPCPSVKSVVKDFLTTDGTEKHGWGAVTRIQELQRELVA